MAADPTLADMLPDKMPAGWVSIPPPIVQPKVESRWWRHGPLLVGVSLDTWQAEVNGIWMHTSVSAGGKLPTWAQLVQVKEAVHEDRPVIQVFPPRSEWVSIAEVLHLWERIDAPTVPEGVWRRGGWL